MATRVLRLLGSTSTLLGIWQPLPSLTHPTRSSMDIATSVLRLLGPPPPSAAPGAVVLDMNSSVTPPSVVAAGGKRGQEGLCIR